jgi:hypothetical protein
MKCLYWQREWGDAPKAITEAKQDARQAGQEVRHANDMTTAELA